MSELDYKSLNKLSQVQLPNGTAYALVDRGGRFMLADKWASGQSYVAGDFVIREDAANNIDGLYKCITSNSDESFNTSKWEKVQITDELKDIREQIAGGIHYRGVTTTALYDEATTNPIIINSDSFPVSAGDLVIADYKNISATYAANTAYNAHTYLKNGLVYYITNDNITAGENTSIDAIASKLDQIKGEPEFLFDGTKWHMMGANEGFGDLAFKDSASGSYVKPTGSGSVTVKEYSATKKSLDTTTLTGVSGSTSASKATAGTAVDVAKVGSAVTVGSADVDTAVVYGTANKAATATTIGNADVGTAVVYGTANKASSATTVGNADVGTAVVYGKADVGDSISGLAELDTQKTFVTNAIKINEIVEGECLVFSAGDTGSIYGVKSSAHAAFYAAVAAPSNQTLTPAKAANTTIYGAVDAPSSQTLTPAKSATATIYGAVDAPNSQTLTPAKAATRTITPAESNGTITPYTFEDVTVPVANSSATTVATGSLKSGNDLLVTLDSSDANKTVSVGTTSDTVVVK